MLACTSPRSLWFQASPGGRGPKGASPVVCHSPWPSVLSGRPDENKVGWLPPSPAPFSVPSVSGRPQRKEHKALCVRGWVPPPGRAADLEVLNSGFTPCLGQIAPSPGAVCVPWDVQPHPSLCLLAATGRYSPLPPQGVTTSPCLQALSHVTQGFGHPHGGQLRLSHRYLPFEGAARARRDREYVGNRIKEEFILEQKKEKSCEIYAFQGPLRSS